MKAHMDRWTLRRTAVSILRTLRGHVAEEMDGAMDVGKRGMKVVARRRNVRGCLKPPLFLPSAFALGSSQVLTSADARSGDSKQTCARRRMISSSTR